MTDRCRVCGAELPSDVLFCPECGVSARLGDPPEAGAADPPSAERRDPDPFSTPFEADRGDAALLGLPRRKQGARAFLLVALLGFAGVAGYLAHDLVDRLASQAPPPASGSGEGTALGLAAPASAVVTGTELAVAASSGRVAAAERTAASAARAPRAAATASPPGAPNAAAPVPSAAAPAPAASAPPPALVRSLAATAVGYALSRAQALEAARAGVAASSDAGQRRSARRPVPDRAFAIVAGARATGAAEAALAAGAVPEARAALVAAREALGGANAPAPELSERIDRAAELLSAVETQLAATRCGEARASLASLAELSPPLRQRYRRPLEDCVERDERNRGLPPRTLE